MFVDENLLTLIFFSRTIAIIASKDIFLVNVEVGL